MAERQEIAAQLGAIERRLEEALKLIDAMAGFTPPAPAGSNST
jgi:hypothetical protein